MVILFDIDGTLIDHDAAEREAVASLFHSLGRSAEVSAALTSWEIALDRHYARYLAGELTIQQQRRERLREVVDSHLSDEAADKLSAFYLDRYLEACRLYPDVTECLEQISAFPLGVISNGEREQQWTKLSRAGIAHCFQSWTLSAECGAAKPDRRIFELACSSHGVPPSEAIYVGDRLDVDADGASNAGLLGVWIDRAYTQTSRQTARRIRSLADLPALVSLLGK